MSLFYDEVDDIPMGDLPMQEPATEELRKPRRDPDLPPIDPQLEVDDAIECFQSEGILISANTLKLWIHGSGILMNEAQWDKLQLNLIDSELRRRHV